MTIIYNYLHTDRQTFDIYRNDQFDYEMENCLLHFCSSVVLVFKWFELILRTKIYFYSIRFDFRFSCFHISDISQFCARVYYMLFWLLSLVSVNLFAAFLHSCWPYLVDIHCLQVNKVWLPQYMISIEYMWRSHNFGCAWISWNKWYIDQYRSRWRPDQLRSVYFSLSYQLVG
jgi:hypothetical protein